MSPESNNANSTPSASRSALALLVIQGAYFAVLGIWPILGIHSFQAVSGPKTDHLPTGNENDHWLVFTVGALIATIGVTLLIAAYHRFITSEMIFLGGASALVLAIIDVLFVYRRVIAPIYLVDAVVEVVFCLSWIIVAVSRKN
jgi:hypothetical protein